MESRFQTSFIPKKPIETGPSTRAVRSHPAGLLRIIAVFLLIISLVLWGAVFLWKSYLNNRIDSAEKSLQASQREFDLTTVTTLTRLNNRLNVSSDIISNHLAISKVFSQLEAMTLRNVRFTDLAFGYAGTEKGLTLGLKGQAISYAAVAKQSDAFSQNRDFRNPLFADLNLDSNGKIIFTINTALDPKSFLYTVGGANNASTSLNNIQTTTPDNSDAPSGSPF